MEHFEIVSNQFEASEEKKIETYQRTINLEETCVEAVQSKQVVTSQNETTISTKTHEKQEYSENLSFSSTHQERSYLEEQRINEVDSKCDSIDLNKIHNEEIRAPNSPSLDAEIKTQILEEDDARQKLDFDTKSANGVNEDSDKHLVE